MSEDNKRVVRAIEEAWDSGKLDELDQYFAPNFFSHAALPGMPQDAETRKMIHGMSVGAMPDRKVEIEEIVAEGDKVFVRCHMTGTNKNGMPWLGAEANNAPLDVEMWSLYRLENGKVVEHWGLNDALTLLVQNGVWAPPPMPGA